MNPSFVLQKNGQLALKTLKLNRLQPEWVRLKVLYSGICGTDVQKVYSHSCDGDVVLGHEFVGRIVQSHGSDFKKGALVAGMPLLSCGKCFFCNQKYINLCKEGKAIGRNIPGAFAKFVDVPVRNCFSLEENQDISVYVLTDVVAVCLHALNYMKSINNQTCMIIGDGAIGCTLSILLKQLGAKVYLVGKDKRKQSLFANMGILFRHKDQDINLSADYVFETVGRSQDETIQLAIKCVNAKGKIIVLGVFTKDYRANVLVRDLFIKEVGIIGTNAYEIKDFRDAILMIKKNIVLFRKLITHILPFNQFIQGIEYYRNKSKPTIKVVIDHGKL